MEFGIFDSFDLDHGGAGQVLANRLRFAAEAERLGIDSYHVTEHHGTPLSVCPSPNLFLAALSQRTSRMRMGVLVNVLPAHEPFRLAEEIAVLDQFSGGRLDLGVGSGVSPFELSVLGVRPEQSKAIYAEALEAITSALRTGRMRHDGELLRSYDAELSLLPVQRPYPPLWYASSNAASAEWAGCNGVNFVGRWNNGGMVETAQTYWNAWETHRDDDDRLNPHAGVPRVGLAAAVVIARTRQQAQDLFGRANDMYCDHVTYLWRAHGQEATDSPFSTENRLASGTACVGTAESVRDQIVHQVESAEVNYFQSQLYFGDMTYDEAQYSLREFVEQVAPAARRAAERAGRRT
jgi:alkanesulfonate monooxygenase SsuD/methylene tetrahydromethanopterin reductase-like flavin-dependent oxidoreductase (luciferase family)